MVSSHLSAHFLKQPPCASPSQLSMVYAAAWHISWARVVLSTAESVITFFDSSIRENRSPSLWLFSACPADANNLVDHDRFTFRPSCSTLLKHFSFKFANMVMARDSRQRWKDRPDRTS